MTDDGIDVRQLVNNHNAGGTNQPGFVLDATGGSSSIAFANTRASAQTITDYEGLYRQASNNELCWDGLRRQHNLVTSGRFNAYVAGGALGVSPPTLANTTYSNKTCFSVAFASGVQTYANSYYSANHASGTLETTKKYLARVSIALSRVLTTGENIKVRVYSNAADFVGTVTIDDTHAANSTSWVSLGGALTTAGNTHGTLDVWSDSTLDAAITVYVTEVCIYNKTGSSETCAGEVVSIGVAEASTFNSGIDGIQYYATTNGNTVGGNGVITEATGTVISNTWTGLSLPYARINRKTYSEDMDAAGWSLTNATAPDDGTLGPDAIGQLQKFTDNATNAEHSLYGSVDAAVTGTRWTASFHVKAGTLYGVVLRVGTVTDYGMAEFRFSDMTVVTSSSGGTGTFRNAWIERVGLTSIYRISVCATFSGAILGQAKVFAAQSAGTTSYVGTSQYCYLGFADFTGHDNPGCYIPNKTTGTTTHAVNAPTLTGPSNLASNGNITIVAKFKPFFNPAATWKQDFYDGVVIGSGTVNYLRSHYANSSLSTSAATKRLASVSYDATQSWASFSRLQQMAVATGLRANVIYYSVNGAATATNANSGAAAQDATITLGDLNGLLQRVEIWPRAFSEAEYIARSTP